MKRSVAIAPKPAAPPAKLKDDYCSILNRIRPVCDEIADLYQQKACTSDFDRWREKQEFTQRIDTLKKQMFELQHQAATTFAQINNWQWTPRRNELYREPHPFDLMDGEDHPCITSPRFNNHQRFFCLKSENRASVSPPPPTVCCVCHEYPRKLHPAVVEATPDEIDDDTIDLILNDADACGLHVFIADKDSSWFWPGLTFPVIYLEPSHDVTHEQPFWPGKIIESNSEWGLRAF